MEAGVDLLILETFSNLNEIREAIFAAREAAGDEMVIIAHVTIDDSGHMPDGTEPETYTEKLNEWPADVIGLNCSVGPKATLETIERMMRYSEKPMSAMPNAGLPTVVEGRKIYLCSPEYMAQYARRFLWAGVKIVGGCCGTTAEHIKLIRSEARSLQPQHRGYRDGGGAGGEGQSARQDSSRQKSKLGAKLAAGKFVAFVEILPPRGVDASKEIEGSKLCAEHGIDCINVPDGPRASARLSAQVTCQLIQEHARIEAVMHFCCRDRNILGIQSELLGAHTVGVRNLICITGDPPRMGTYPEATAVFDVDAIGLTNIVNNLNHGLDIGGNPDGLANRPAVGCGRESGRSEYGRRDPAHRNGKRRLARNTLLLSRCSISICWRRFSNESEPFKLPVVCGIWPLTSYRNAEFMVNELRVPVPEPLMERMRSADSAEKARQEGIAIAQEMVVRCENWCKGFNSALRLDAIPWRRSCRSNRRTRLNIWRPTLSNRSRTTAPGSDRAGGGPPSARRRGGDPHGSALHAGSRSAESECGGPGLRRQRARNPSVPAAADQCVLHGGRSGEGTVDALSFAGAAFLAGSADDHCSGLGESAAQGHRQYGTAGDAAIAVARGAGAARLAGSTPIATSANISGQPHAEPESTFSGPWTAAWTWCWTAAPATAWAPLRWILRSRTGK